MSDKKQDENIKLTVIMPSLNVAKYMEECIRSVINQSIKDIEILCIDAGSTDGTIEIIDEYRSKDDRVTLIKSEIKSYGYQCNLGIKMARGKYIGIVETDDYVDEEMFLTLYETAEEYDLDCVKINHCGFVEVKDGVRYQEVKRIFTENTEQKRYGVVLSPADNTDVLERDNNIWNGIYKRSFLQVNNIRFNETKGAAYQDMGFLFQTICQAKRIMYLDKEYYHYRRDNENSSVRAINGLEMIWGELNFCRSFLEGNKDIFKRWWKGYYYKLSGQSISNRVADIIIRNEKLSDEEQDILMNIREELRDGLSKGLINADTFSYDRMTEIDLMIRNIHAYAEYIVSARRTREAYQNMILEKAKNRKQVAIFGCARIGKRLCVLLTKNGDMNNISFCDNDKKLQGTELLGYRVFAPDSPILHKEKTLFFVTGRGAARDMFNQLTGYGVEERDIVFYKGSDIEL